MAYDIELARGHFEQALSLLDRVQAAPGAAASFELFTKAEIAHGAGARRLRRVPRAPWFMHSIEQLRDLERRVRDGLDATESVLPPAAAS